MTMRIQKVAQLKKRMFNTVILVMFEKSFHTTAKKFIFLATSSLSALLLLEKIYPFYLIASYAPHTKKNPKMKFQAEKKL